MGARIIISTETRTRIACPPPPPLSDEVVERTRSAYVDAYEQLTGRKFEG